MNSLFAKILLWFWATLAITILVSSLIGALTQERYERTSPYMRAADFILEEARHAYEQGGNAGLRQFMARYSGTIRRPALFTDAAGRNLLNGSDDSVLIREARQQETFHARVNGRDVALRGVTDGRYWLFLQAPQTRLRFWFGRPELWWVISAAILLCYWLAWYLTRPIRQLQHTVERFGQGDLRARAGFTRKDEVGELARAFDRMAGRLETLVAAERRLLADISHELRSPLARLGVATELARSGETTEERETALNRIEKESERLNSLVGELLQVTRAEGDPRALRAEPVQLDRLLSELAEDARLEAGARGCSVELQAPPPPVTVQADPELLRRAIENVVRNAIRYTPAGRPVELGLERHNGSALIRVRDYGPGVPETALPRIFDAFYRVESDRDRASGGVGLGLSIARRAVQLHKGEIRAENAEPGLRVEIEIPMQRL